MSDVQELNINNSTYDIKAKSVVDTNSGKLKFWSGTQAQYDAITTKDPNTLYNVTDTDPSYSVNTQYKNIGAIVQSMVPLTDAGLHLLDGSLIQMGVYSEFVEYMANLYGDGTNIPNYFCTESEWQASVEEYGVCGKFVYDSVNNTVRLPKVTGIVEGTTDLSALGDLVEAGLPNITGGFKVWGQEANIDGTFGAFYTTDIGTATAANQSTGGSMPGAGNGRFSASRSSSIYGNSSTVQPQTIKVLYYIVVATTSKTEIQSDIDEIATDLNGKADVDLSNVTDTGYIKMARASMPSATTIFLTVGASGSTYTAPANGWVTAIFTTTVTNGWGLVTSNNVGQHCFWPTTGGSTRAHIPVRKGSIFRLDYGEVRVDSLAFTYAVGSESEAS